MRRNRRAVSRPGPRDEDYGGPRPAPVHTAANDRRFAAQRFRLKDRAIRFTSFAWWINCSQPHALGVPCDPRARDWAGRTNASDRPGEPSSAGSFSEGTSWTPQLLNSTKDALAGLCSSIPASPSLLRALGDLLGRADDFAKDFMKARNGRRRRFFIGARGVEPLHADALQNRRQIGGDFPLLVRARCAAGQSSSSRYVSSEIGSRPRSEARRPVVEPASTKG